MKSKEDLLIDDDYFKASHKITTNSQGDMIEEWSLVFLKNHKDTINKLLQLYNQQSN